MMSDLNNMQKCKSKRIKVSREHRFKCYVSLKSETEFRGCNHSSLKGLLKEVGFEAAEAIFQ